VAFNRLAAAAVIVVWPMVKGGGLSFIFVLLGFMPPEKSVFREGGVFSLSVETPAFPENAKMKAGPWGRTTGVSGFLGGDNAEKAKANDRSK